MPSLLRTLLLLLAVSPAVSLAQDRTSERAVRIAIENDLFALRTGKPDDHDYTHGTRVQLSSPGAPEWLRGVIGGVPACRSAEARRAGCVMSTLQMGQEIYTPRLDGGRDPIPGERPYSGWLFIAPGLHHVVNGRARSVRLLLGVTGPESLAEEAQDGMHALLGERQRPGWANQLRSEVGVGLAYEERLGVERALGGERVGALSLQWGGIAGSVRTGMHVGALVRLGVREDLPWSPEEPEWTTATRLYAIAGFRQELVLRNLFVDGNTFHESVRAERIPWVAEATLGLGVRRDGVALEYRWVRRGREYEAQLEPHAWGSVAIVLHWH